MCVVALLSSLSLSLSHTHTHTHTHTQVNTHEYKITVTGPSTFTIPLDTSSSSPYLRGGYLQQIKQAHTHTFTPLAKALTESKGDMFVLADFAKMER
jgi:hypothetical protein